MYLKEYENRIGFTTDTTLWPKKKHANILLDKIELISPGLTQRFDDSKKKIVPLPIRNAVYRRFHYDTNNRKDQFGITSGKISFYYQKQEILTKHFKCCRIRTRFKQD